MNIKQTTYLLAVFLGGCGTSHSSQLSSIDRGQTMHPAASVDAKAVPTYSCSLSKPKANNYHATINVFESSMTLLQSSDNARYAKVEHTLVKQDFQALPTEEPSFECCLSRPKDNSYTLRIQLYKDRVVVLQSSMTARYAPITYSIVQK